MLTEKERFCNNIKKYESSMYAVAFSVVQNDADVAEVISESIYRAYSHLDSLKNTSAFKAWILRIVHNTAVELVRKNSKYIELESAGEIAEVKSSTDLATKLALQEAVNTLKQPYRTVVTLFYYEGLSVRQIAEITDTRTDAVKQQLSRARKMLRELLKEDFANE